MSAVKRTISVLSVTLIALAVIVSVPLANSSVKNDMNGDGVVKMMAMGTHFLLVSVRRTSRTPPLYLVWVLRQLVVLM